MAVKQENLSKDQQFDAFLKNINKQYGEGSIFFGNDNGIKVDVLSTGIMSLDLAIGVGGLPKGRIIEIFGAESSGKTSIALHVIASAQKNDMRCLFVDVENALSPDWAEQLGVNLNLLAVAQPDSGEEALQITESAILSRVIDVVVVDSVSALLPRAELEGSIGDSTVGLQARLMSSALRKLAPAIKETGCIVIFINQLRDKIQTGGFGGWGDKTTTSGGRALPFYASVRMEIKRVGTIKEKEEKVGSKVKVTIKKNKVAPPFREAEFDMMYAGGVNHFAELLDLGVKLGIVNKTGAFYKDPKSGEVLGHGLPAARQKLAENPEYTQELERQILEKINVTKIKIISSSSNDDDESYDESDG